MHRAQHRRLLQRRVQERRDSAWGRTHNFIMDRAQMATIKEVPQQKILPGQPSMEVVAETTRSRTNNRIDLVQSKLINKVSDDLLRLV